MLVSSILVSMGLNTSAFISTVNVNKDTLYKIFRDMSGVDAEHEKSTS